MLQVPMPAFEKLAEQGTAGVLIALISVVFLAAIALIANQRLSLAAHARDFDKMTQLFTTEAERSERRLAKLTEIIEAQQTIQTNVITENTLALRAVQSATEGVEKAVTDVARIVERCHLRDAELRDQAERRTLPPTALSQTLL